MQKAKLAFIGLGDRGMSTLKFIQKQENADVVAVCDVYEERVNEGIKVVSENRDFTPSGYTDYQKLLEQKDIEGVIVTASWVGHSRIAIDAMEAGKYVAIEAGGASDIIECWELVRASERTGMPCMMLENCCYGRKELAVLNMVKKNVFGEVVHCQGGYQHDLRDIVQRAREHKHYRLAHYMHKNCESYPTHEIGPIAKWLNIHRGNQFQTLVSMSSKARGLNAFIREKYGEDDKLANYPFAQGDVVTTMIKCAGGETILLTLDTSLPRPYSRGNRIEGTRGIYMEDNNSIYIEKPSKELPPLNPHHDWESFDGYLEKYEHPLWKEFYQKQMEGGAHGGMDVFILQAFVDSVINKTPTPIDVYDTASWMAISCLSEQSINLGSTPVHFPDFTCGKWITRKPENTSKYSLDIIND